MTYLDTHVVAWLYAGTTKLLSTRAQAVVEELRGRIGVEVCDLDFSRVVASARELAWTRDPFDRMIVAHALAAGRGLLTKDRSIRRRFRAAFW